MDTMLSRRRVLQGAFGLAATGLFVPSGVETVADDARRIWALWSRPSGRAQVGDMLTLGFEDVGRIFLHDGQPYVVAIEELPRMGAFTVKGRLIGPTLVDLGDPVLLRGRLTSIEMGEIVPGRLNLVHATNELRTPR